MGQAGGDEVNIALEVAKLIVAVVTPVVVAVVAYRLNKTLQKLSAGQWANQKVVEKRIAVFDEVAPALNDLYCFFEFIGNWKELTPPAMIAAKREIDKKLYVYSALFPRSLMDAYNRFIHLCFKTYVGSDHDAQLRTSVVTHHGDRRKSSPGGWDVSWEGLFVANAAEVTDMTAIKIGYFGLMSQFSSSLGIGLGDQRGN